MAIPPPRPDEDARTLLEAVGDLEHDLGKYLRLPLAMLPDGAADAELRRALGDALLRTRWGAGPPVSARALWERFTAEFGPGARRTASWPRLDAAVREALALEPRVDGFEPLDRVRLQATLGAVAVELAAMRRELSRGR